MPPRFVVGPDGKFQVIEDETTTPAPRDPIMDPWRARAPDFGGATATPPPADTTGLADAFGPGSPGRMSRLAAAAQSAATPEENLAQLEQLREPAPTQLTPEEEPIGELPGQVEGLGGLERAAAERKITQLENLRAISEGLGQPIPVEGDIRRGRELRPFIAEGIRNAIGREDVKLADLATEDKLRLQSELRGEREAEAAARQRDLAVQKPGKPLPVATMKEFRGAETAIRGLEDVLNEKKDQRFDTGPIANAFEVMAVAVGLDWERLADKTAFKNKAARIAREYIFSLSGKQTSGAERKDLLKLIPKGNQNDNLFARNLRDFQAFLRKKQNVILESAPENTPELEQLRGMMDAGGEGEWVRMQNVKTGQVQDVHPDDVAQATDWKRI